MGLDMYLYAEKYVSGYSFCTEEERARYVDALEVSGLREIADPESPSATIKVTVAYWRKANAIHKWFVDNVQEGKDDCKEYWVDSDQLRTLRDTCQTVLDGINTVPGEIYAGTVYDSEHPNGLDKSVPGEIVADSELAHELLPTASGFFFGRTDYDEWYVHQLKNTVEQIDRILAHDLDGVDFKYHSSW